MGLQAKVLAGSKQTLRIFAASTAYSLTLSKQDRTSKRVMFILSR